MPIHDGVGNQDDLMTLGDAAAMAIAAGVSERDFVAAVHRGVVDTRIVDGLPRVARREMEFWCRIAGLDMEARAQLAAG